MAPDPRRPDLWRKVPGSSPVLCLLGPTASGKTAVAFELAKRAPVELISVDSAMIYRGMDIGTAKPTPVELEQYPHALIDIRDPAQSYSAADFLTDVDELVQSAIANDRIPVLVGGTMLYFRAFREGLADMPSADPALRAAIEAEANVRGWAALHDELTAVDPQAAALIHPNNPQRLQRALEVWRLTGQPISRFWAEQKRSDVATRLGVVPVEVGLVCDPTALQENIATRFQQMVSLGLIDEVNALRERGDLTVSLPALRTVGYRQVWAHLDGQTTAAEMAEAVMVATRRLAKRQRTWMRSWQEHLHPVIAGDPARMAGEILGLLEI